MIKYILKFKFAMWSIIKNDKIDCQKNLFVLTLHNIVQLLLAVQSVLSSSTTHSPAQKTTLFTMAEFYTTPTYVLFQMWMDSKR